MIRQRPDEVIANFRGYQYKDTAYESRFIEMCNVLMAPELKRLENIQLQIETSKQTLYAAIK
jgi:citrate synthase